MVTLYLQVIILIVDESRIAITIIKQKDSLSAVLKNHLKIILWELPKKKARYNKLLLSTFVPTAIKDHKISVRSMHLNLFPILPLLFPL